jgi:hypothetical protein
MQLRFDVKGEYVFIVVCTTRHNNMQQLSTSTVFDG